MKKVISVFMFVIVLFGLAACKEDLTPVETIDDTIDATLLIENITLTKGESVNIDYQITPAGTFGVVTFEIMSSTPANTISITGTTLVALEAGTASVKATATNMSGASKTFTAEKTFTVTINPIPVVAGQFVLNGGFEFGMNEWTVESLYGDSAYGTAVVDNYPHSGEAALNLWYDDDLDELSDPLDLKLTQTLTGLSDGTYLFSLWYQGTATSITMTAKNGSTVLVTEEFSGYDYHVVPDHDGYVNYGFEVVISGLTSISIEIHILGAAEAWGYLDDVSFKLGTIDDLEIAPASGEDGYVNFIEGGSFASLDAWTVEITGEASNKTATLTGGRLSLWTDGAANYKIYQEKTLIDETYNLVIYLNGGVIGTEFNADDAYAYVKMGETIHELALTPEGWNSGELKRVELADIALSGTVEIGIYINFTGGSNNWINLDDFALWSYEIEVSVDDVNAALAVDALIDALPIVTELTIDDETALDAARAAYDLLTPLQKSYVLGLSTLIELEEKLELLLTGEDGFVNFIDGGSFASLDAWTVEITGDASNKTANITNGQLSIWSDGAANFKIYQEKTLIEETYNLVIYLNGGAIGTEFNADDAYAYVKIGEVVHELELSPVGWNNGLMKRVELSSIALSGTVEIGIHINFTGGSNNWINLDDFALWSYEIEVSVDDVNAALAVDALIDALPIVTELTTDDETSLDAARAAYDLLTPLQKSYVLGLSTLVQLEEKMVLLLTGNALDVFNTEGTFQAGDSWLMSAINWTVTAGNVYVTDWGYNSTQSYNVFKDQTILTGSIEKDLALETGDYDFSIYIAGGGLTSFTVKIGEISQTIEVTSGDYTLYSLEFSIVAGTHKVEIEMVRPNTDGWVHIDDVMIVEVVPSALDLLNADAQFESTDWSMASINWTVTGGTEWTDGDWPQAGTQSYNFFKDVSTLEASISRELFLEANTYTVTLYFAGGDLTSLTMSIGDTDETFTITASYAMYTFDITVLEGTYPIVITAVRPTTSGWVHLDNLSILVKDVE